MRLVRFNLGHLLLSRPRPANYLDLLRPCALKVAGGWWEFDRDAPCYRKLEERFKEYVPTTEDVARFELLKAERRAQRDDYTRRLWASFHRFTLTEDARDPVKLAAHVAWLRANTPCGECVRHLDAILLEFPPDAADPFVFGVNVHNAVNRLPELKKRQWTVEEALAKWGG